jgi:hypothetical protein
MHQKAKVNNRNSRFGPLFPISKQKCVICELNHDTARPRDMMPLDTWF